MMINGKLLDVLKYFYFFLMKFGISALPPFMNCSSWHQRGCQLEGLLVDYIRFRDLPCVPSGSWQMQHAGSRRPWRRRSRPNCPCPSLAVCPGTARPRLLATPAVTWRLPSLPQSPPPPPSAAARLQVRQVCVLKCVLETKKGRLLILVEWMEVLKLANAN